VTEFGHDVLRRYRAMECKANDSVSVELHELMELLSPFAED